MFGIFKKDPIKKLQKELESKLIEARDFQRKGDIVEYSLMMSEAEEIGQKIDMITYTNKI